VVVHGARGKMSYDSLSNTICNKGHTHPPWNTTGILSIAKCESVCGFCQKETKTAANLRKHVAIHIKNERLNLTIAEGSSGRGRLEILSASRSPSSSSVTAIKLDDSDVSPDPTIPHRLQNFSASFPQFQPPPQPRQPRLPLPTDAMTTMYMGVTEQQRTDLFHPVRKFNIGTKIAWDGDSGA